MRYGKRFLVNFCCVCSLFYSSYEREKQFIKWSIDFDLDEQILQVSGRLVGPTHPRSPAPPPIGRVYTNTRNAEVMDDLLKYLAQCARRLWFSYIPLL